MAADAEREAHRLRSAQERLADVIRWPDERLYGTVARSSWTPAQHVEHVSLANAEMLRITANLIDARDPRTTGHPTFVGRLVAWTGRIPRGVGPAPAVVQPSESPSREALKSSWALSVEALDHLAGATDRISRCRGRARHQIFGRLTPAQWLTYARIHSEHHLRILDALDGAR